MSVTTVITDGGFDVLRAAPNHKLVYTKAVCGSGHVDKTRLAELTEVAGYEMDLSIVDVRPTEDAATVRLQLDNRRAAHEFQLYQIGLYAKLLDDDDGAVMAETLFQVMQYDLPDIVRAVPHVSEFVINTIFGQAKDVEGIIDLAAYVSLRQFKLTIDGLIRDIMMNELTLPLSAAGGEELLTASGTPLLAVYHPDKSAAALAAVEALDKRLSGAVRRAAAGARTYADGTGQRALAGANAYTDGKVLDLTGKIGTAKQEAITAAGTDAAGKVAAAKDDLTAKIGTAKQEAITAAGTDAAAKVAAAKDDLTGKINTAKQEAITAAGTDAAAKVKAAKTELTGKIGTAKQEAINAATQSDQEIIETIQTWTGEELAEHNVSPTAHPLFLRAAENTEWVDQKPEGGVFQEGDLEGPQTIPDP